MLVGTPAYHDPDLPDVAAVAANVTDLVSVLTDPLLGGLDPAHCARAPWDAGIAQVGALLVKAAEEAEDLLLFYYSGHGLLSARRRELYLSLAGTRHDQLAFTALPFDAVRDAWLESRATSRVVILDCCFSGRAIGQSLAAGDDPLLVQIQVSGTYTMTSAPSNRTAVVLPGETNTAFTGRLLGLLRTGIAGAGAMLSLGDIYKRLYAQLSSEGLPLPQQRGTATADLIGLVRNRLALPPPPAVVPIPIVLPPAVPPVTPASGTSNTGPLVATLVDTGPPGQPGLFQRAEVPRRPPVKVEVTPDRGEQPPPPVRPTTVLLPPQPRWPTLAGALFALAAALSLALDICFWLGQQPSKHKFSNLAAAAAESVLIVLVLALVALRPRRADRWGRPLRILPAIVGCFFTAAALPAGFAVSFSFTTTIDSAVAVLGIAILVFLLSVVLVVVGFPLVAVAGSRMRVWNKPVAVAVAFVPVVWLSGLYIDNWVPSPLLAACLAATAWMVLRSARFQRAAVGS